MSEYFSDPDESASTPAEDMRDTKKQTIKLTMFDLILIP